MPCKRYTYNIIEELKSVEGDKRANILSTLHQKKLKFFQAEKSGVYEFIKKISSEYIPLRMTKSFVDIYDHSSNQYLHPQNELESYVKGLASSQHERWQDLICLKVPDGEAKYQLQYQSQRKFAQMLDAIITKLGKQPEEMLTPKYMDDEPQYAPTVIFQGLLHCLHVAENLRHNLYSHIFLFEPNSDFFVLSTYFLDYELIKNSCQRYYLSVGHSNFSKSIHWLMERRQCV